MCTPIEVDTEVIVKSLAVVMGLLLAIFLPAILFKQSHRNAVSEGLLPEEAVDPSGHSTLEKLFEWRDLIVSFLTGVFVLEFAVADKLDSTCAAVAIMAHVIAFGIVPFLLLMCSLLVDRLGVRHRQPKVIYWFLFCILVVPWYVAAVLFVFTT